jgi:hypothetical protein
MRPATIPTGCYERGGRRRNVDVAEYIRIELEDADHITAS